MKTKEKKVVIKRDDYIKIINPIFVMRTGYELTPQKIQEEILKDDDKKQEIFRFLEKMGCNISSAISVWGEKFEDKKIVRDISWALAYRLVEQNGFGGKERKLFTETKDQHRGVICRVLGKKVVRTGIYHNGGGGHSYDGDYEYTPAYLEDVKSHVLLNVMLKEDEWSIVGDDHWIEDKNVEKVLL